MIYEKDKHTRITLRLNEAQFNFVKDNSDLLGVSPSEFLRMVVNMTMASTNALIKRELGGAGRENDKADSNNIV